MNETRILTIASVPVQLPSKKAFLHHLCKRFPEKPSRVFWANAHCINQAAENEDYLKTLQEAEFLLNDGAGIELAGWIKGIPVKENLNGTDLIPEILDRIAKQKEEASVFLLGGRKEGVEQARQVMQKRWPSLNFIGSYHGFSPDDHEPLKQIATLHPDILIVGTGVPKQELFVTKNWRDLQDSGVKLAIAGGAVLDFLRGKVPRAPKWMQKIRMEWLYRLFLEPSRLWRRYLFGNLKFFSILLKEKL